jgi:predicted O-methyltransferase YrrM
MGAVSEDLRSVVRQISALPADWHGSGTVDGRVIDALGRNLEGGVGRSIETGTGRTTLLFSHLSRNHTVFTVDDAGDGDSLRAVRTSPLLDAHTVSFVLGRTQETLRAYGFDAPLQLAYLDGPHGYPFPELEYWAVYPHIEAGGLLVIDDVHLRTVHNMFRFLRDDDMWDLVEVVGNTAFFRRTDAPTVDPFGDGWWLQGHNKKFTFAHLPLGQRLVARAKESTPEPARRVLRRLRAGGTA